jgi:hypothetical protein
LATRQSSTGGELASALTIFGAGLVGAGLALLFAPER